MDTSQEVNVHFSASGGPLTLTLRGDFPPVTATYDPVFGPTVTLPVTQTADGIQVSFTLEQGLLKITPQ
jgi:hypothetical protein